MKSQWGPRWDVMVQNKATCQYCGLNVRDTKQWDLLHVDHLVPRSKGGENVPLNHVLACNGCNMLKGNFDPTFNGEMPLSEESKPHLIERARELVIARREKWYPDFDQMVSEM